MAAIIVLAILAFLLFVLAFSCIKIVRPYQRGIVMHTLHHAAEIRGIDAVDELSSVPEKVKPEEMKLARQVIATFEQPLNLSDYKDEYREGLQRIIDAKIAGEEGVATTPDAR